jgi:hypothetical protein
MSETEPTSPKQLTIDDPIEASIVQRLQDLRNLRLQLCEQYVDLDMEKIKHQVAIRQLDAEKDKLFIQEVTSRGLDANTTVEIDPETRKILVVGK